MCFRGSLSQIPIKKIR